MALAAVQANSTLGWADDFGPMGFEPGTGSLVIFSESPLCQLALDNPTFMGIAVEFREG